ncbi:MAG: hypothetical protein NC938_02050 [Candidatus Omnitrophica bacterium]|nr:hypothetical protein [Candidatus Omnitrophota bacterium]
MGWLADWSVDVKPGAFVAMVALLAFMGGFALSYDDESAITIKASFVNPYSYSENRTGAATDAADRRYAVDQDVPKDPDKTEDAGPLYGTR